MDNTTRFISNIEENDNQTQPFNNFFHFDNLNKIYERIEDNYKHLSLLEASHNNNFLTNYGYNDISTKIALLEEKIRVIYARKCISVVSSNDPHHTPNVNNSSPVNLESKEVHLLRQKAELLRKLEETELTIKMLTSERL